MTKQGKRIYDIALRAKELGGRAMLVGGCVRDGLLGIPSADIDCEVYGACARCPARTGGSVRRRG